jgi:hypothetical protein
MPPTARRRDNGGTGILKSGFDVHSDQARLSDEGRPRNLWISRRIFISVSSARSA